MAKAPENNKELESAIKEFLKKAKASEDLRELSLAINCAIKWEAVKMKMADNDFGSHFNDDEDDKGNDDE